MIYKNGSMFTLVIINEHQLLMPMLNSKEPHSDRNLPMFIIITVLINSYIWDKINSILHLVEKSRTSISISSQEAFQLINMMNVII